MIFQMLIDYIKLNKLQFAYNFLTQLIYIFVFVLRRFNSFRFVPFTIIRYLLLYLPFACVAFVLLRRHYGRARDTQRYRDNNDTCYHHSTSERRGQQKRH